MSPDGGTAGAPTPSPREGLAQQLRQLEEFVARTESDGDEMPAEAVEMIARLREIMEALDGLSASMGDDLSKARRDDIKMDES
ncbi:MAG: hypothetical protein ABI664_08035 [bacterium]